MSAKPLTHLASEKQGAEAPHLLKLVEAASAPSQTDPHTQESKKAKGSSLGSLKLAWLDQVTADTNISDLAFRCGHKIAQHINDRERRAWPKIKTMALSLSRSDRTVQSGVHELVYRQHLKSSKRGSGNLNQYELLLNSLTVEERDHAKSAAVTAGKAVLEKRDEAKGYRPGTSEAESEFKRLLAIFPPRKDAQDREAARISYESNLSKGIPASVMLDGAEAYRKFCDEEGNTGTDWTYTIHGWLKCKGWRSVDPDTLPHEEDQA